jgi:hypothetical protein
MLDREETDFALIASVVIDGVSGVEVLRDSRPRSREKFTVEYDEFVAGFRRVPQRCGTLATKEATTLSGWRPESHGTCESTTNPIRPSLCVFNVLTPSPAPSRELIEAAKHSRSFDPQKELR